jgi:hypothetical protein
MKKHLIYYDFLEAMDDKGCPICSLTDGASEKYLASLFREGVNNPPMRRRMRRSLGFCNSHSWKLRDMGDSLAMAILYKDLLETLTKNLRRQR